MKGSRPTPPVDARNCKAGDWAIVVSNSIARGRVVRCLKWAGKVPGLLHNDQWATDLPAKSKISDREWYFHGDANLRPLRGTFEEIVAQVVAYKLTSK